MDIEIMTNVSTYTKTYYDVIFGVNANIEKIRKEMLVLDTTNVQNMFIRELDMLLPESVIGVRIRIFQLVMEIYMINSSGAYVSDVGLVSVCVSALYDELINQKNNLPGIEVTTMLAMDIVELANNINIRSILPTDQDSEDFIIPSRWDISETHSLLFADIV